MGGYTTRKRAFIIGLKYGEFDINIPNNKPGTVRNALSKVTNDWFNYSDITKPKKNGDIRERM